MVHMHTHTHNSHIVVIILGTRLWQADGEHNVVALTKAHTHTHTNIHATLYEDVDVYDLATIAGIRACKSSIEMQVGCLCVCVSVCVDIYSKSVVH